MLIQSNSVAETAEIAAEFSARLVKKEQGVVLFYGAMGAGKTTFISQVIKKINPKIKTASPTFSIINQYAENIFHVDLYRINDEAELQNTDFYDIVSGQNFVFIEWAEKFGNPKLYDNLIKVEIEVKGDGSRVFNITD